MASSVEARFAAWQEAWVAALPRRKKITAKEWEAALAAFLQAIRKEEAAAPLGFWGNVRVLYRFQRWLAASTSLDKERLRPLVVAIILNHILAR